MLRLCNYILFVLANDQLDERGLVNNPIQNRIEIYVIQKDKLNRE